MALVVPMDLRACSRTLACRPTLRFRPCSLPLVGRFEHSNPPAFPAGGVLLAGPSGRRIIPNAQSSGNSSGSSGSSQGGGTNTNRRQVLAAAAAVLAQALYLDTLLSRAAATDTSSLDASPGREELRPWAVVSPPPPPAATSSGGRGGSAATTAFPDVPRFSSIAQAVGEAPSRAVILVEAGRYRERLVLSRPVTIQAHPPGAAVEVVWETDAPYESTVEISPVHTGLGGALLGNGSGPQVVLRGLTVRHASKSIANNYGIYIKGGSPFLVDCDVSSSTGAGVGIEGAAPHLLRCRVHDCARQGLAVFGGLASVELDMGFGLGYGPHISAAPAPPDWGFIEECDVYGNALDGILVRDGAAPDLIGNNVHNNKGYGLSLQDFSGRLEGNALNNNRNGPVAVTMLFGLE